MTCQQFNGNNLVTKNVWKRLLILITIDGNDYKKLLLKTDYGISSKLTQISNNDVIKPKKNYSSFYNLKLFLLKTEKH